MVMYVPGREKERKTEAEVDRDHHDNLREQIGTKPCYLETNGELAPPPPI